MNELFSISRFVKWSLAIACAAVVAVNVVPAEAAETAVDGLAAADIGITEGDIPRVLVNGIEVSNAVLTTSGHLLVPLRPLFEAAGGKVYWDSYTRSARIFFEGGTLTVRVGQSLAWRGNEEVTLAVPALIIDGLLYIPLRFAVDTLGGEVVWDGENREAAITLASEIDIEALNPPPPTVIAYTEEELTLLTRVINAEAYDEPYIGKVAVGAVVINRAKGDFFAADNIKDVIMSGCQFSVVCNGQIYRLPVLEESRQAAMEALRGRDPTGGALFFANLRIAAYQSFWQSLHRVAEIGNHTFFKHRR